MFDDSRQYWYHDPQFPQVAQMGVKVPDAGVRMRVVSVDGTTLRVRITGT